jgi:hypothetical protein
MIFFVQHNLHEPQLLVYNIPVRVHKVDTLGRGQVQSHTSCLERDENNTAIGLLLELDHGRRAIIALHGSVQSRKRDLVFSQAILKKKSA